MISATFLWTGLGTDNLPEKEKWMAIREYRNRLLSQCDWTQLADAALTLEEKQTWAAYRQALRNIPQEFGTADDVIFPGTPA